MVSNKIGVFVCHRRADAAGDARRLYVVLADRLGRDQLTLDTETIDADAVRAGAEFAAEVEDAVGRREILLAVIGTQWLSAVDSTGRRRIDDPADRVRLEIEAALSQELRIICVLVGGAEMPRPEQLPEVLAPLASRQAFVVRDEQFDTDAKRLADVLELLLDRSAERTSDVDVPEVRAPATSPIRDKPQFPTADEDPHLFVDENVQFTVYRPRSIQRGQWSTLLAFAHLAEQRADAGPDEPDPLEEVRRQAEQVLGDVGAFAGLTLDSSLGVPREGEITFLPDAPGVIFNPVSRTFRWLEPVHREEFRLRAMVGQSGETIRGRLSVFLGVRLLAEIPLQLRLTDKAVDPSTASSHETDQARPYRRIFASYSHRDVRIAEQFERYAAIFGDRYLRDWIELRAGEKWSERLEELIREADVFQLFWSSNSMRSPNVRREWEYALALGRPHFVRPTYWEAPMPRDDALGLPPPALASLHFHRLAVEPSPQQTRAEPQEAANSVVISPTELAPPARRPAFPIPTGARPTQAAGRDPALESHAPPRSAPRRSATVIPVLVLLALVLLATVFAVSFMNAPPPR